jgi:hypothetical protein
MVVRTAYGVAPSASDDAFIIAMDAAFHADRRRFLAENVNSDTDASALFERYRATTAELRAKNPRTTTGWRALAKHMLGRAPYGTIEYLRREEYNTLLRRAFRGIHRRRRPSQRKGQIARGELIAVLAAATKRLQKIDDFATPVRMPR